MQISKRHRLNKGPIFFCSSFSWWGFFCNNQYRILESKCQTGSEQLRSVFEGHLAKAGQMLLMLDTFVKPSYMTRAWCIFEAFVCIDKDFPMTIILPERAQAAFIENLDMSGGFTLLKTAFETMDVRRARASSTADEATRTIRYVSMCLHRNRFQKSRNPGRVGIWPWLPKFQELHRNNYKQFRLVYSHEHV